MNIQFFIKKISINKLKDEPTVYENDTTTIIDDDDDDEMGLVEV